MSLELYHIIGIIFTLIFGTLLHYTYNWSGKNKIIGIFSPINECIWEHLKLLFTPVLIYSIVEFIGYGRKYSNFIPIKAISIVMGLLTIITVYYCYTFFTKRNYLWVDIGVFVLSVLVFNYFSYFLLKTNYFSSNYYNFIGWAIIIGLFLLFFMFTFKAPKLLIFKEPDKKKF